MGAVRRFKALFGLGSTEMPPEALRPSCEASNWERPYETLRRKWVEVPTFHGVGAKTMDLLSLSDEDLLAHWEKVRLDLTTGTEWEHRGWYHALYADGMRGKKVMDVGSGFGVDSITFAQHGAKVTFVDIVESNLSVLRRICKIMKLTEVQFHYFKDLDSLKSLGLDYDVIMGYGISAQCSS